MSGAALKKCTFPNSALMHTRASSVPTHNVLEGPLIMLNLVSYIHCTTSIPRTDNTLMSDPSVSISPYSPDFWSKVVKIVVSGDNRPPREFSVSAELLVRSSPVFTAMMNGEWKESKTRCIQIDKLFSPEAFEQFLNALAWSTMRERFSIVWDPVVISAVIPVIVHYQVDHLKQMVISAVKEAAKAAKDPASCLSLVVALETGLPEEDVPEWDPGVYTMLNKFFYGQPCGYNGEYRTFQAVHPIPK
jgi:hypothetical protein